MNLYLGDEFSLLFYFAIYIRVKFINETSVSSKERKILWRVIYKFEFETKLYIYIYFHDYFYIFRETQIVIKSSRRTVSYRIIKIFYNCEFNYFSPVSFIHIRDNHNVILPLATVSSPPTHLEISFPPQPKRSSVINTSPELKFRKSFSNFDKSFRKIVSRGISSW